MASDYLMHCIFITFFPMVQTCERVREELLKNIFLRLNLHSRSFETVILVYDACLKEGNGE